MSFCVNSRRPSIRGVTCSSRWPECWSWQRSFSGSPDRDNVNGGPSTWRCRVRGHLSPMLLRPLPPQLLQTLAMPHQTTEGTPTSSAGWRTPTEPSWIRLEIHSLLFGINDKDSSNTRCRSKNRTFSRWDEEGTSDFLEMIRMIIPIVGG